MGEITRKKLKTKIDASVLLIIIEYRA